MLRATVFSALTLAAASQAAPGWAASGADAHAKSSEEAATAGASMPGAAYGLSGAPDQSPRGAQQGSGGMGGGANTKPSVSGLPEVIVTAQHRSENLQTTPIAIVALSQTDLRQRGVINFTDVMFQAPTVHAYEAATGITIAIRGLVTVNPFPQGDPAISYNVDDVYYARSQAIIGSFFDIDRVEVLKGPQGTTYGRNALAGAVNIVTRDPGPTFGGEASLEVGNYNLVRADAVLNVPLTSDLAVRAAFDSVTHDGYISNHFDDADQKSGRIKLLYKPLSTLSLLISGNYTYQGGNGPADVLYPYLNKNNPWQNNYYYPDAGAMNRGIWGINARLSWNFGPATLVYIPAYTQLLDNNNQDEYIGGLAHQYLNSRAVSHEIRVISNTGSKLDKGQLSWMIGGFIYDEHQRYNFETDVPFTPFTLAPYLLTDKQTYSRLTTSSRAVYAQATYAVLNRLRLVGGLRYTDDKKTQLGQETLTVAFPPFFGVPETFNSTGGPKSDNLSYKAQVEADLTSTSMLYGGVTTGYHAGGEFVGTSNNIYRPEYVKDYEGGIKSRWFDGRAQINADAYYYDYTGVQTEIVIPPLESGVANAKSAYAYGVELDTIGRLTRDDRLAVAISYEHTRYTDFFVPSQFGPTGGTDVPGGVRYDGEGIPLVSSWSGTMSYDHTFRLARGDSIDAGVSSYFRTAFWGSIDHSNPNNHLGGFTNTAVHLVYSSTSGHWTVTGYIKNLENQPDPTYVSSTLFTFANPDPPRTYGVLANFRF